MAVSGAPITGQVRGIAAAIATISVVGITTSLSLPLLAIILEERGASDTYIGLNTMMAGVAAIIATPYTPRIAQRLGVGRFTLILVALMTLSFYAFYLVENVAFWFPLRLIFHGAITSLFILSEFWISALAPPEKRGLILGFYATILSAGFAAGPLILSAVGSDGAAPFLVGCVLTLLASIPVLLAFRDTPEMSKAGANLSIWPMLAAAPVAVCAAFVFGAAESSGYTFLSLFGIEIGFSETQAVNLITALAFGGLVFQLLIGYLADKFDKRKLQLLFSFCGLLGGLALMTAPPSYLLLLAILVFWGGTTSGLYTVGLAQLGDRFSGNALASANAAFVFTYACGMLLGPASAGIAKDTFGPNGYLYTVSTVFFVYCLVILYRLRSTKPALDTP